MAIVTSLSISWSSTVASRWAELIPSTSFDGELTWEAASSIGSSLPRNFSRKKQKITMENTAETRSTQLRKHGQAVRNISH